MSLHLIGLALGTSFAAGLNLYATVATLGLLERFGVSRFLRRFNPSRIPS